MLNTKAKYKFYCTVLNVVWTLLSNCLRLQAKDMSFLRILETQGKFFKFHVDYSTAFTGSYIYR
ncbi:hypothetical protein T11_978 [Trichinella zimbabwensis]|uniref:Uncharacterized protein n=1 Tax=Trichinella zimbabwensis TaxID=268475 RepID=A0A0V1HI11_9BILA|nr:hypothetical protein T11_978 [Trichinella zimbabwensis]